MGTRIYESHGPYHCQTYDGALSGARAGGMRWKNFVVYLDAQAQRSMRFASMTITQTSRKPLMSEILPAPIFALNTRRKMSRKPKVFAARPGFFSIPKRTSRARSAIPHIASFAARRAVHDGLRNA